MIQQSELGLLDGFERALINDRLRLVYQPKINLSDGSLKRVEALVRWDDPEMGSVPPSRFVPLAERHGLIDEMTRWGLATAFRQCREWRDHGHSCSSIWSERGFPTLLSHVDWLCCSKQSGRIRYRIVA